MIRRRRTQQKRNSTTLAEPLGTTTASRWLLIQTTLFLLFVQNTSAFQVTMSYKPPVKSSVKKLYDQRFPADRSSPSDGRFRKPSRQSAVASSTYAPVPPPPSFEQRMRQLVTAAPRVDPKPETEPRSLPKNLKHVESLEEYKKVVGDEREKVVAVRFYASYCRACKAVAPLFYRLAHDHPDVIFVDVPVTARNQALHQGLGVPSLPYGHIYHPNGGLVEEHKLTRKHIDNFREKLETYVNGVCELPSEDNSSP